MTLTCEDDFVSIRELSCGPQSVRNFEVSVDFSKFTGAKESEILVQAAGCEVKVKVKAVVVTEKLPSMTFVERDGIVSMEAEHFAANESKDGKEWKCLKEYGKTLSSMKVYPMGTNFDKPGEGPSLSYSVLIREAWKMDAICGMPFLLMTAVRVKLRLFLMSIITLVAATAVPETGQRVF